MKQTVISAGATAAALPVVAIVAAVVTGVAFGVELSLLVIAGGVLAGVIALLWASVQSLTGESPLTLEEALTLGAPSAEEEQKRAVLRALKDLEFERSVGKISEEDYADLSARYRAEAKRLMQLLDEGAQADRERAEKALQERLAKAASVSSRDAEPADASEGSGAHDQVEPEASDTKEKVAASRPTDAPAELAEGEKAS